MNIRKLLSILAVGLLLDAGVVDPSLANFQVTAGSGTTVFAYDTGNQGTGNCASVECPATVLTTTAGAPLIGQQTSAGSVPVVLPATQITALTPPTSVTVTQATASSLNATVSQATGSNLHVVCDSGCSSSSAPADESAFTAGTTPQTPVGGFFQTTATNNPLSTGQMGAFQVTANRAIFANLRNAAGAEVGVAATPVQVSLANTAANATGVTVAQATAANLNASVVQSGNWTVRNVGNAGANFDGPTGSAVPANALLVAMSQGGNSTALTGTSGSLNVNITGGAGSGGVAQADNSTWTAGTTQFTPAGCEFTTGGATAITTARAGTVGCTSARAMFTDLESVAATALGTPTAYGSTPTGNALSANVFVTNTNANGSATSANSSPVVIASDQAAIAIKAASGAFASGSIASGALASGSIAAGAGVSGAFVAGAIADLAHGQGTMAASVPVAIASNQSAIPTTLGVATTGGALTAGAAVPNNTTAVVVKSGAGTLYGVQLYGIGAAPAYLKIYNATSATCGSGTPVKRLIIPAASTAANGAGSNVSFGPQGVAFGTGITYCITTGIGDADTTAPAASTFLANLDYD